VAAAERRTGCEFVVVLAPASSRYEGRVWALAVGAALAVYLLLLGVHELALDLTADPVWLLAEAVAMGALAMLAARRSNRLLRLLVPRWRQSACVDAAAEATFTRENVSLTRERNAVLLYISVLEGEARLVPDIGLTRALRESRLGEIKAMLSAPGDGDPVERVESVLEALGRACGECFARRDDDINELPDKPQIRLP
jgi:putative membrane protein